MPVQMRHYRFGGAEIDGANMRLTVDGVIREIEPKAFRLLLFLAENAGRAVSKQEILAAVWSDAAVTDNALTRAIAQLRKALGDDSKAPRFIETIPTVGYRFLGTPEADVPAAPPPRRRLLLAGGGAALALGAGAFAFRENRQQPAAPGLHSHSQLTSGSGLDINAVFSPAGGAIAYASDRSGAFEIYLRGLDTGAGEKQITANGGQNLFPSFAPDGQSLAFSSFKNPGIFRTPVSGGPPVRLTKFGAQPVWSPDGQWIVFLSHDRPTLSTTDYYWPVPNSTLWIVAAAGGDPREITPPARFAGGQTFPSWRPDSKEIRFVNYASRAASLWTYSLEQQSLRKRFDLPAGVTLGSATISRDSRRLFYISSKLNGDIGVWLLRLDPDTLAPEGVPAPVYQPSIGAPRDLAISPDGSSIVFSAILSESRILLQDLKSGESTNLSRETGYRYNMPSWSPDGRAIVYTKLPVGGLAQSWIDRLDGKPPVPAGRNAASRYFPQFVRDGNTLRQLGRERGALDEIEDTLLADGSVETYRTKARLDHPSFSPDGKSVAYHSGELNHQVWRMEIPGGNATQLTSGEFAHGFAHFSRDNARIQVQRIKAGGTEVWVLPATGGPMEPVIDTSGHWFCGGWSADGKSLLVAGNQGDGWALHSVPVTGRTLRRLTPDLPLRSYVRYPRMSPLADRIAYEWHESKGNVFLARIGR